MLAQFLGAFLASCVVYVQYNPYFKNIHGEPAKYTGSSSVRALLGDSTSLVFLWMISLKDFISDFKFTKLSSVRIPNDLFIASSQRSALNARTVHHARFGSYWSGEKVFGHVLTSYRRSPI